MPEQVHQDEPAFVISVAARLVNMHPQTLRYYERAGLVHPTRSSGRIRLYSQRDIDRLRKIARLTDDLGVNLAGVEVILRLTETLSRLQHELEERQVQLDSDSIITNPLSVSDVPASKAKPSGRRSRRLSAGKSRRTR